MCLLIAYHYQLLWCLQAQQGHCLGIVHIYSTGVLMVNTLRPRQNGRHFAVDTFKRIFLNENVSISMEISLKFIPKGPVNNIPALVQIMAWRRPGDKPLSEPKMVRLPTRICITRPQWVNSFWHNFKVHFSRKWFGIIATDISVPLQTLLTASDWWNLFWKSTKYRWW